MWWLRIPKITSSWCDIGKDRLMNKGVQRTLGILKALFWSYYDARADKSKAKEFGNVVHPCMIRVVDESTPVLLVVPPPELHLMMGTVNHLFHNLEKVWPGATAWLDTCHVKRGDYHGGAFEGNDCRTLLKKVSKLREICPRTFNKFADAFESFDKVVKSCFGSELSPGYVDNIREFTDKFKKLDISVTPKVHAVMHHVEEFCEIKGKGLGPWSEQTSESIHHDFNECWKKYFLKDMDREEYPDRILNAVRMYNGLHL